MRKLNLYENNLQICYGVLKHDVIGIEGKNKRRFSYGQI